MRSGTICSFITLSTLSWKVRKVAKHANSGTTACLRWTHLLVLVACGAQRDACIARRAYGGQSETSTRADLVAQVVRLCTPTGVLGFGVVVATFGIPIPESDGPGPRSQPVIRELLNGMRAVDSDARRDCETPHRTLTPSHTTVHGFRRVHGSRGFYCNV